MSVPFVLTVEELEYGPPVGWNSFEEGGGI
jgi:hypothetical protein